MDGKEVLEQNLDEIVSAIREGRSSTLDVAYELGLPEPYVWCRIQKITGPVENH